MAFLSDKSTPRNRRYSGSSVGDDSETGLDEWRNEGRESPPPNWSHPAQRSMERPTVWTYYGEKARHYDNDLVADANNMGDVLLIFAALFSAIVTAFITQTYPMLQADPSDLLTAILRELQHPGSSTPAQPFIVPPYAMRVNCFLFAGLFISMIVALLSILVKQWAKSYQRDLSGVSSPHLRARIRHFRYRGARRWHFADLVGMLSILMLLALFTSAIGIIDLLLSTARPIGYVALSIFSMGVVVFIVTTVLPLIILDAPFRSPLSKLLKNIKRIVMRNIPRSIRKKEEEEGLEDHFDQLQRRKNNDNNFVRTHLHLDLDILSHLLGEADKSTERWLLDLCFDKLSQLSLLEKKDPEFLLRRNIIIEVYTFLAKGCVTINKDGKKEAERTRLQRARRLCKFLSWYLSLRRTSQVRDELRQLLEANNFDPKELPIALAQDDNNTTSVTRAASALGRLEHLQDPQGRPEDVCCIACSSKFEELYKAIRDGTTPIAEKSRLITAFLIQRSDCLAFWEKTGSIHWNQQHSYLDKALKFPQQMTLGQVTDYQIDTLQQGFRECALTDNNKKIWEKAMQDRDGSAGGSSVSEELKRTWFTPLSEKLNGLTISRSQSPIWRNTASSTSSNPTFRSPSALGVGGRAQGSTSGSAYLTPTLNVPPVGSS